MRILVSCWAEKRMLVHDRLRLLSSGYTKWRCMIIAIISSLNLDIIKTRWTAIWFFHKRRLWINFWLSSSHGLTHPVKTVFLQVLMHIRRLSTKNNVALNIDSLLSQILRGSLKFLWHLGRDWTFGENLHCSLGWGNERSLLVHWGVSAMHSKLLRLCLESTFKLFLIWVNLVWSFVHCWVNSLSS